MDADKLNALADRCEAAEGPSFELFAEAFEAIHGGRSSLGADWSWFCSLIDAEAWLDAAMTLVPEGYDPIIDYTGIDAHGGKKVVELYYGPEDREIVRAAALTGPLALCAAALRALASQKGLSDAKG